METCRAIRRLKSDPVPEELLEKLVHYATRAPSAGNAQLWRFVIVTDAADRKWFGDLLRERRGGAMRAPAEDDRSPAARGARTFQQFFLEFDRIPAFIITAVENAYPSAEKPNSQFMWSTVYGATQNLLLAARAMGLGAAMTTMHMVDEPAFRAHFGIPEIAGIGATIPVGYPEGRYGPVNRRPASDVTYWGRWGAGR
jgi:nitroreductase